MVVVVVVAAAVCFFRKMGMDIKKGNNRSPQVNEALRSKTCLN